VILLPYTRLHTATARLANLHAPGHVRARIDPRDDGAYWQLLATRWNQGADLVLIEHDIGIGPEVLPGFDACRQPWCGHPYPVAGRVLVCLGCVRFTAALQRTEPDLLEAVGEVGEDGLPAKHWRRLDVRVGDELNRRGYRVHRHEPPVAHFHRYPTR
jgi:hypothetical protein